VTDPAGEPTSPPRPPTFGPLVIGIAAIFLVSLATTTLNLRGAYFADARLEHVLAPRQFLTRHLHAWDDARGAGVPAVYFSPAVSSMQSLLDLLGFSPWLIGRLTLTVYLTVAGSGALVLASRLRPEHRWMPIASGFLYAFSPFTSQFLIPSGLFVPAAALPWLLIITIDGLRDRHPWRHAARFALVVFTVGLLNTASLLYSLMPVVLFAVFLVVLEHSATWRSLARFAWRTVILTGLVSAAMLAVLTGSLATVARNISTTELPSTVAQTSSASESWRGLGFWLTYFRLYRPQRPGAEPFFTSAMMIALTYVPVGVALIGVATRRVRYWSTWVTLMAIGVVVMVGAHRAGATPLASLTGWIFDNVTATRTLRSTYKAGTAVVLAVALLAPAGVAAIVDALMRRLRRTTQRARITMTTGVCAVTCLAGVLPFAGGWTFNEFDSYRDVPAYWDDFFEVMSEHPDDRVLVLPGASRYRYGWGFVNDNLFDAKLEPSAVFVQTISGATAPYTSVVEELDDRVSADDLDPESFAPMLRLLGARWVLVQRDVINLDFEFPARLRSSPGLSLDATFGTLADGTPALELFQLEDDSDPLDAVWSDRPPVLVSGGEGTLANLVRVGWLDAPLVNFTALSEGTRDRLVSSGAEIVVSDGAQRRGVRLGLRRATSVVLPADVELSRPIFTTRPDDTSTQTVLDTGVVTIDGGAGSEGGEQWSSGAQPSLLLDGSLETGWRIPQWLTNAVGRQVRIRLDRPTLIESVVLSPLTNVDERIDEVEIVHSSDGTRQLIEARLDAAAPTRVSVQRRIDELTITITSTTADDGPVGLAEVQLIAAGGPLDTASSLRVPDEIERLPGSATNPISYVFGRLSSNEEGVLRRRFTTIRTHEFDVTAQVRVREPVDAADGDCVELLSIDGVAISVRPVGDGKWAGDVIDVEGCQDVVLESGEHVLEELASRDLPFSMISLRDVRADDATRQSRSIRDERRSSSRHAYEIPPEQGYLYTTIPFHHGWALTVDGRPTARLDTFAGTGWTIAGGETIRGTLRYGPQRRYEATLAVTALSLLVCVWLAVRRRPS
jgi:hypothetical protein